MIKILKLSLGQFCKAPGFRLQRLGAGWPDALVDTLAVGLGGFVGLFLWRRAGIKLAVALAIGAAVLWRGVRARK